MVWGLPLSFGKGDAQTVAVSIHRGETDIAYTIGKEGLAGTFNHLGEIFTGAGREEPAAHIDVSRLRAGLTPAAPPSIVPQERTPVRTGHLFPKTNQSLAKRTLARPPAARLALKGL